MGIPLVLSEVPNTAPYIQYVATNGQTVFPYPFPITQDSDLVVVDNGATLQTDSGYTLSGQGNDTGGNVTFNAGRSAGDIITLYRDIPIERISQIAQNSGFSSTTFNAEFNNIYLLLQQLETSIGQCLQIPNTNYPSPTTTLVPGAYAGKYLAFDANGNPTPAQLTSSGSLTQGIIAGLLYPQTSAEQAAGVTPTSLQYQQGDVRRYGADPTGVNDSSAAFTKAFAVKGLVTAVGSFKVSSGLTLDISTTSLVGPCVITSGLAANAGALITVIASAGPEANIKQVISGVEFIGQNLTGVQALDFNTNSNADETFGVQHCAFADFADAAYIHNNAWEIEFHTCDFSSCGGDHAALYSHFSGSERVSAVQCAFFNCTECVRVDGGGGVFLTNCSLDYSTRVLNCQLGNIVAAECYFESNTDTDYWFKVANADAMITLDHCLIAQTGAKTAFNFGQSLAGYGGGIYIRNTKVSSSTNAIVNPLIAGSGNAYCSGLVVDGFASNLYAWSHFSSASNLCSNGTFANGSGGLGGWTVGSHTGSGGNPTASANTLALQVSLSGQDQYAYWTINAEPGQNVGFQCSVKGNVSTAQFSMTIRAVGADGVTIATSTAAPGMNQFNGGTYPCPTSYATARASMLNLPAGTATVQFELNTNGATNSSNIIDVQSVVVGKY